MNVLIYDTETTGLPVSGSELDPEQPWIVQLAAIYYENFEEVTRVNAILKPPADAFFHPKAVETHGITPEMCDIHGIETNFALRMLREIAAGADAVAAYNLDFDDRMIRSCSLRADFGEFSTDPVFPESAMPFCIMKQAMVFFGQPRKKLEQIYKQLFDKRIENAHDALADTVAAGEVFFELLARQMAGNE